MTAPDPRVPHVDGHGFDPSVCNDCREQKGWLVKRCGLCGCPTAPGMPMDRLQAPPENCVHLDLHARAARR